MDKSENAKCEADEENAAMLGNTNKAGETIDAIQKAEGTSKNCKESPAKPKGNQKLVYLRANKGLIAIVLVSAVIIFAVVVAMLATTKSDGHGHGHGHGRSQLHNITKKP